MNKMNEEKYLNLFKLFQIAKGVFIKNINV